ncbi:MAG: class II glutamine amidotransferase [Persicimonas sp.]
MCRLFGFRSVIASQVHRSLVDCENALVHQSEHHPDGWGVAYYVRNVPHVIKSARTAVADNLFQRVSGIVSSQTVVAHLRRATTGQISMVNCHPFQYGHWIFAHNGQIPNFEQHREAFLERLMPELRRFVLGDTDSEVLFYLLLSHLAERTDPAEGSPSVDLLVEAAEKTVEDVHEITGENCYRSTTKEQLYLSFLLTDGRAMVGHQGGKQLFYSTHKTRCPERGECPSFSKVCEMAVDTGKVNHMIFSSEPLSGDNVWQEMAPGQIVAVDRGMNLHMHNEPRLEAVAAAGAE